MNAILARLVSAFFSKKKIIGYVAALLIAIVAAALGMSYDDVKEAIAGAPVIAVPTPSPSPDPELVKALGP